MACAYPLHQFKLSDGSFSFTERGDVIGVNYVPCGQCNLCRAQKAAEWTTRLVQEGFMHRNAICATLTYSDDQLPELGSLSRAEFRLWKWRLRDFVRRKHGVSIVVDGVGEYSPGRLRPHYHVCIYGWWPHDAVRWSTSGAGNQEWVSQSLSDLWKKGRVTFQPFSEGAASYCAGHQAWKLTGGVAADRLAVRDVDGTLLGRREKEFHAPPGHVGLGATFFEKYRAQMIALGYTVVGGKKVPLPKYYLRIAEKFPELADGLSELKAQRELGAFNALENSTDARMAVREECAAERVKRAARGAIEGW